VVAACGRRDRSGPRQSLRLATRGGVATFGRCGCRYGGSRRTESGTARRLCARAPSAPLTLTAALLNDVAASCICAVRLEGSAPDALGECLCAAGGGRYPSYNPIFPVLWLLRGRKVEGRDKLM